MNTIQGRIVVSWSGGKDSALALYEILKTKSYDVVALLTTVVEDYDRISIHGVGCVLLEAQAEALGLPLEKMLIRKGASDLEYEAELIRLIKRFKGISVYNVLYGDIFLVDIKEYRDDILDKISMKGVYPLWRQNSTELANRFIDLGFKAVVTVVDQKVLGKEFAGREYDKQFLSDLPESVDPCGENGEFHSFVYYGPIFSKSVIFTKSEAVLREDRFWHCDLIP